MIEAHIDDGVAWATLNRPAARNAISLAGWKALADVARTLAKSDAKAVILTGAGASFSAGADLVELAALGTDEAGRLVFRETMRHAIDTVAALPMPVIAAVDGGCHGAGVALALAADMRVAGDAAIFATTPAKLGIGYPGTDVARLIALVGPGQAARMLLSATPVDADEAARIGLAEVRAPDARAAARDMARGIADLSPASLRLLKRALADPSAVDVDMDFDSSFGTADFADRIARFHGRRR